MGTRHQANRRIASRSPTSVAEKLGGRWNSIAHLLPNFDEYTVAYRDRSAIVPERPVDPRLFSYGSMLSNVLLIGPTGVGKSWLASALGHKACRDNRSVLYQRVPRLFEALALARGDGRHPRLLRNLGRADLLILDDWGLEPLDAAARHDLLEILEERYGRHPTMITSQLPVDRWHEIIGDPTYADAILDRLVHNAHRIELAGESMRRTRGKQHNKA